MRLRKQFGGSRALIFLLILLHGITLAFLVRSLVAGRWGHVGLCVLCITLYSLPALLGLVFRASIPPLLYGIAACFAAAANLGGEVSGFYLRLPFWDSALHFIWGVLAAVIGYSMPDLLSRKEGVSRALPKAAAVLLSVSFSMLIAVFWEFVEFAVDLWFHTDMQKDCWIYSIYSVFLQPEGLNQAQQVDISNVIVNGESWPAYLDIGLRDTMFDLLWTFIGAIPGAALVLTDFRRTGRSRILGSLLPRPKLNETKDGAKAK